MNGNKRQSLSARWCKQNIIRLVGFFLFILFVAALGENRAWGNEQYHECRKYLRFMGNKFYCLPKINFHSKCDRENGDSSFPWPFDIQQAKENLGRTAREIMERKFDPVIDTANTPLRVIFSVLTICDGNAISAYIELTVQKYLNALDRNERDEFQFYARFPVVFYEEGYLHINPEYFPLNEDAEENLAELIQSKLEDWLTSFVNNVTELRAAANMD